jgi:hypothetical protein
MLTSWRIHALTVVIAGAVLVSLAVMNLLDEDWNSLIVRESGWSSGWPMWFAYRSVGPPADAATYIVARPWFDGRNVNSFRWWALAVDLVIAWAITVSTVVAVEKWLRRLQVRPQFSLKFLFAVAASVALYAGMESGLRNHWSVIVLNVATFGVYAGIALTCFVAMEALERLCGRVLNRSNR